MARVRIEHGEIVRPEELLQVERVGHERVLRPRDQRLGWRYNLPLIDWVVIIKRGKSTSREPWTHGGTLAPHGEQDLSSTQLAALALYLASDASSYMTGSIVFIDGGYTLW